MPLTPADVHNVAFKKPPIGKRGYDDEEVDAFLDLVEAELARLIEENNGLRAQVSELEGRLAQASAPAPAAAEENPSTTTGQYAALQQNAARQDEASAPVHAAPVEQAPPPPPVQPEPVAPVAAPPAPGLSDHEKASRILALASETADRHLSEAKAEADQHVAEARQRAEQQVAAANEASERQVNEARAQAEQHLGEARSKADALLSDSQSKASATEQAAQSRAQELTTAAERKEAEILRGLAERRSVLERRIETLRAFESEYRSRVHGFLQNQLKELESQPPLEPDASAADAPETSGAHNAPAESGPESANAPVSGFVGAPDAGRPADSPSGDGNYSGGPQN